MPNEPKISLPEAIIWIFIALIFDLLTLIPIVNILSSLTFLFIFQLYLIIKGIGFRRKIYSIVGSLIELIPLISVLPALTAGVVATIFIEKSGVSKALKVGKITGK